MKIFVNNKKAFHNYFLEKSYEGGLELKGTEVKSIVKSQASLDQSYVLIKKNEVWLFNAHISPYDHGNIFNVDPLRNRKILLHRHEILKISHLIKTQKYLLIPTKFYAKRNKIKVEFCLAKPKKLHDKREDIKQRDLKRYVEKY